MSHHNAIAAVTATIQGLISREGIAVTAKTPDRASEGREANSINVFLYHTLPNASWRNADLPHLVRSGEVGFPPLALNLHYLVTAYGDNDSDLSAQVALGRAMRVLHDRSVLSARDIRNFTGDEVLSENDLDQQLESVKITPDPLSVEDLTRLWSTFKSEYRVSAAYQASVVLIESKRTTRANPPVITRGRDNRGVNTRLGFEPILDAIEYRRSVQDQARPGLMIPSPGEAPVFLRLLGKNFPSAGDMVIRNLKTDIAGQDIVSEIPVQRISDTEASVEINSATAPTSVGSLTAEFRYEDTDNSRQRSSNGLSVSVPPLLKFRDDGDRRVLTERATVDGKSLLTVHCQLAIQLRQRAVLVLAENRDDDRSIRSYQLAQEPDLTGSGQLSPVFDVSQVQTGTYWLRLRVDGVDSVMLKVTDDGGFEFDPRFKVVL